MSEDLGVVGAEAVTVVLDVVHQLHGQGFGDEAQVTDRVVADGHAGTAGTAERSQRLSFVEDGDREERSHAEHIAAEAARVRGGHV